MLTAHPTTSTPLCKQEKGLMKDPQSLEKHALEAIMMMKKDEKNTKQTAAKPRPTTNQVIPQPRPSVFLQDHLSTKILPLPTVKYNQIPQESGPNFNALLEAAKTRDHNFTASRKKIRAALGLRAGPWTKQEDRLLRKAVDQVNNAESRPLHFWTKVAESVPFRDNEQCRNRWRYHVNPDICNDPFTPDEFRFFLEFQRDNGNRWTELGRQLKGRSRTFIANEWQQAKRTLSSFLATKRGVPESSIITQDGKIDYQDDFELCLKELISKREKKIVREKFSKCGNETSDTESLSDTDTASLSSSPEAKTVTTEVKERSPSPSWTVQEDHVLMTMATQLAHFPGKWSTIADRFSRRSAKDCRDRWETRKGKLRPPLSQTSGGSSHYPAVQTVPEKRGPTSQQPWGAQYDYTSNHVSKRVRADITGHWIPPRCNGFFNSGAYAPPAYCRYPVQKNDSEQNILQRKPSDYASGLNANRPANTLTLPVSSHLAPVAPSPAPVPHVQLKAVSEAQTVRKDSQSWTKHEDEQLRSGMERFKHLGADCMSRVAQNIPGRDAKQCQQRWVCQIQPGLNKDPLTPEQIRELLVLQRSWGNRWTSIGQALGGRNGGYSKSFVSNRWFHRIRPALFRYLSDKHGVPYSELQSPEGVINYGDDFEGAVKAVIQEVLFNGRRYQNPGRL